MLKLEDMPADYFCRQQMAGPIAMNTILVVDDDPDIRGMLAEYLPSHGFSVLQAGNGTEMKAFLRESSPRLVLLDVALPGEDGLSLARHLREHYNVGIIMVSGAGDTVDRIIGLEVGADDYIAKPFDLRELLARVKSVTRRYSVVPPGQPATPASGSTIWHRFGQCRVDLESHRALDSNGNEVEFTSMEFKLLRIFLERPNRVLSRDHLLNLTQNREWDPYDRSIDIRVARLRKKIECTPGKPQFIKTVRGAGYRYVPSGPA
ncbi:response regulator [Marinobacter sp. ATCH36]|uniref:response regulator n=1 Tax=Marinobacter sp. ATCH36 TaxID=2945106 RepID=UPI00201FC138|nr:response regulator [Marinobacter sp. ATCH36]MCL7943525.1 response regulator [Marinobacter sp. ATCH36]